MLTYETPFPAGLRVLLFCTSLFLLWGAVDLLTGVAVTSYFSGFFLFLLIMALAAFTLFLLCGSLAIFGMRQRVTVDAATGKVTRRWRHILPRQQREELPFIYVRDIEIMTLNHDGGPDDYILRLHPTEGDSFDIVKFKDRRTATAEAAKLRSMIGLPAVL